MQFSSHLHQQVGTPFNLDASVQPVNLPKDSDDLAAGTIVTVSGWGTTSVNLFFKKNLNNLMGFFIFRIPVTQSNGPASDVLLSVNVPVVSDADCDTAYGAGSIFPSMLCAGDMSNGKYK